MVLIVGLGNPGRKFQNTRHNVGYRIIDELGKRKKENWILTKPRTFMNQSGKAVKKLITDCGLQAADLLIIHDDIDLPLGKFKVQKGRGSAGHKGVQSIVDELGTKDFWRVRVGICPPTKNMVGGKPKNVEKFVLQKFNKDEEKIVKNVVEEATREIKTRLVDIGCQQKSQGD